MAKSEAVDEAEAKPAAPKSPGQMKLVIVAALALFIALVGAQVAAPLITKALDGDSHAASATDDEELADDEAALEGEEAEGEEEVAHLEPALYVPLDPPFVVSFDEEDGARYLQLTLQAMARSEKTVDEIKRHSPALRNAFLFLLSGYKLEDLATLQGKESLRAALLVSANEVMTKAGSESGIEELYFTSLVIQ